ncbi:MAG: hypothetical protein K0S38_334, partial [Candidatus Paceibacter sp.]|nr:hypothetical protein [Candidatus Paceibacter sp.]
MNPPLRLTEAAILLSSYESSQPLDACFVHGLSKGMVDGVLETVADLVKKERVELIASNGDNGRGFNDDTPQAAWLGIDEYMNRFKVLGIPDEKIIPTTLPGRHTREENDAFLALAKEHGWKRVGVASGAHHMLRTFSGFVKIMQESGYEMDLYPIFPKNTKWNNTIYGSQGLEQIPAHILVEQELERCVAYAEK